MIYVDLTQLNLPDGWEDRAQELLEQLKSKAPSERSDFIDAHRHETWAHPDFLSALRSLVGNKCWYSEVPLEGADPNVDHFRPKGRVKEIDDKLQPTKTFSAGYWWWAFEWRNYRLASMHSNQRRVDIDTSGGKADYFPINGQRTKDGTEYVLCIEDAVPIDPCKRTDVALLWFDSNGVPSCSEWRRHRCPEDEFRVKVSIWLYHLDKQEIVKKRREHMEAVRVDIINANTDYLLWKSIPGNILSKNSFENRISALKRKISDNSEFAGAKKAAICSEAAKYEWILEFGLV